MVVDSEQFQSILPLALALAVVAGDASFRSTLLLNS